jgi:hypothetical protein
MCPLKIEKVGKTGLFAKEDGMKAMSEAAFGRRLAGSQRCTRKRRSIQNEA